MVWIIPFEYCLQVGNKNKEILYKNYIESSEIQENKLQKM